jgi:hypothetical protein
MMVCEGFEPDARDILIDRVQRGALSPEQAEAEAAQQGFGPLAEEADPREFNPLRMSYWSLPMAIAWIAWRDIELVQKQCNQYREHCTHWLPHSWDVQVGDKVERINGWSLERWERATVPRLSLSEAFMPAARKLSAKMSVAQAEKQLWEALEAGRFSGIAKETATGRVTKLQREEWPYLRLFEEQDDDVLKHNALDAVPTFEEVNLPREDLFRLWQAYPVEASMIEPMTRASSAGYVPLSAAILWVCSRGGTKAIDLLDVELWEQAVAELMPLISSGEIEILGTPESGGPQDRIPNRYFAAINVSQPLSDYPFLFSDNPWIGCTPFLDKQHWAADFNDKMFLRSHGPAAWTHLQVKKADVLRELSAVTEKVATAKSLDDLPKMQSDILEVAKQLWPTGKAPPRVKERNEAIRGRFGKTPQVSAQSGGPSRTGRSGQRPTSDSPLLSVSMLC